MFRMLLYLQIGGVARTARGGNEFHNDKHSLMFAVHTKYNINAAN